MTTTLLPPPRITAPGRGRYPAGNGHAAPIATVSAHSDRQKQIARRDIVVPIPPTATNRKHRATGAAGALVRNPPIRSNTGAKSP